MKSFSSRSMGIIALLIATLAVITSAYSTPPSTQKSVQSTPSQSSVSRSTFLTAASTACLTFLGSSQPAFAKEVDPAVKGTKSDPEFQNCLSQCMYDCTKPKGYEQKSRGECLPECKTTCAKTKAQMMKGTPAIF